MQAHIMRVYFKKMGCKSCLRIRNNRNTQHLLCFGQGGGPGRSTLISDYIKARLFDKAPLSSLGRR